MKENEFINLNRFVDSLEHGTKFETEFTDLSEIDKQEFVDLRKLTKSIRVKVRLP